MECLVSVSANLPDEFTTSKSDLCAWPVKDLIFPGQIILGLCAL